MSNEESSKIEGMPEYLLNEGGECFENLDELAQVLDALPNDDRENYRDGNALAIERADVPRLLIVAGPGAGKSHLFISRIEHWISTAGGDQVYVATFVRKLINDLKADVEKRLSEDNRALVSASTLHTLARSILERAGGTVACPLREHVRIIDGEWAPVVWNDVLAFHPDAQGQTSKQLDEQFHNGELEESTPWEELRGTHQELCQFYNAVGFAYLIRLAQDAVGEQPELVEHSRWIIDEYQDFNASEDQLLQRLMADADGVVIAGDDEQALYQTLKNSRPEIIVGHYEDDGYAKAMLPFCSRCGYHICRAASAFMARHRDETAIAKIYLPLKVEEEAEKVHIVGTAAAGGAVDYVRKFMEEHADAYARYLEEREAGEDTDPFLLVLSASGGLTLRKDTPEDEELRELVHAYAHKPAGRSRSYTTVVAYATAAWYQGDNFAVRKVLHLESVDVSDVHELIVEAMESGRSLGAVVLELRSDALERAQQAAELIEAADDNETEAAAKLIELLELNGDGDGDGETLATELRDHPIRKASAREEEDEEATESVAAVDSVALMTITGSKGLSAHHVIVLGCDDVNMRYIDTPLPFFVALTRARDSLHLVTATRANGAREPHPYVLDLPEQSCDYSIYKKTTREVERLPDKQAFRDRVATWASWQRGHRSG
jgi:superfamily I DNA/RNA helicase